MKALLLVLMLTLASCSGSNQLGECIGIADEGQPHLVYKTSVRNTVWSFIGIEMILPPILWATSYAKCPVRVRTVKE